MYDKYSHLERAVAVEVGESSLVHSDSVKRVNKALALVVPSKWSLDAYIRGGLRVPGFVWPHPLDDFWFSDEEPECDLDLPEGELRILYFLRHFFHRKGGDILYKALEELERRGVKFVLIVKLDPELPDIEYKRFLKFNTAVISDFLSRECLKKLYMWADAVPVPSRGGAFERNFYEALAVGTPAFAPKIGPWTEHLHPRVYELVALEVVGFEKVYQNDPVHVGVGPVASHVDLANKLEAAKEIKSEVAKYRQWLRERLSFDAVSRAVKLTVDFLKSLI